MLLATIISALITVGSFGWYANVARKRALKLWEVNLMCIGMMYGAVATGLLLSTFLV